MRDFNTENLVYQKEDTHYKIIWLNRTNSAKARLSNGSTDYLARFPCGCEKCEG